MFHLLGHSLLFLRVLLEQIFELSIEPLNCVVLELNLVLDLLNFL
jgi:hypothetical protein